MLPGSDNQDDQNPVSIKQSLAAVHPGRNIQTSRNLVSAAGVDRPKERGMVETPADFPRLSLAPTCSIGGGFFCFALPRPE